MSKLKMTTVKYSKLILNYIFGFRNDQNQNIKIVEFIEFESRDHHMTLRILGSRDFQTR